MEKLGPVFIQRLPSGMSYSDAEQLCLRLYCTADGIPEAFHSQLSRQGLADMFAELARAGWVHESSEHLPITESSHWHGVMLSIFKSGPDVHDLARGAELVKRFGFCYETPAA
jgi:hypothetical protein